MTEADLQSSIIKGLRKDPNVIAIKIHGGPNQPTALDIIGCNRGMYFELEVKRPGKVRTLTDRQKLRLRRISEAGGKTGVVTSLDEARKIVYD